MRKIVEATNLSVAYQGKVALHPSTVALNSGKLIGIIGPNGAGKSTFLKGVMGLVPLLSGDVKIWDQPVSKIQKKVAYVPQRSDIDWDFPVLVQDVIMMGRYPLLGWFKRPKAYDYQVVQDCLEKVQLTDFSKRQIGQLSGGQQQRVFLARALAQEANLLLLDEPFVGVDIATEHIMIEQLRELRNQGKTIIVVHHDLSKANQYFDEILLINKGIVGYGPVQQIFKPDILNEAYGGKLAVIQQENKVTVMSQ
ncbi:metal ABC transporter ATP-binding protein [Bacillus horti]|uniref:ABC-type Mn2+/Zn2+ transport system ATPase subunit n=1 Tax=Caldalkalibacillus horti TaxID=77523 RepID=A0ABT9VTW1_9BACI|nr:metal ABC transporter ATP-binding protein [Bacillus horti]MDQ0164418.1 ABC-type Mn2+/Zn2+ transport system ATPase subunit [Bacillus horti]